MCIICKITLMYITRFSPDIGKYRVEKMHNFCITYIVITFKILKINWNNSRRCIGLHSKNYMIFIGKSLPKTRNVDISDNS